MVQYWTTETGKILLDCESDTKTLYQNTKYSLTFFTVAGDGSNICRFSSRCAGKSATLEKQRDVIGYLLQYMCREIYWRMIRI